MLTAPTEKEEKKKGKYSYREWENLDLSDK